MCLASVVSRSESVLTFSEPVTDPTYLERFIKLDRTVRSLSSQRGAPRISIKYKPTGEEVMRNAPSTKGGARVPRRSGVGGLFAVPGLVELLADPEQIGVLDAHTRRALKTQVINALILLHKSGSSMLRVPRLTRHRQRARQAAQMSARRQRSSASKPTGSTVTIGITDSRCGTANCCASPRSGSTSTSANVAAEKSHVVPLTRRRSKH